ncbi:MAG: D-alanyl-D-alanine carboxypeptidase family protein [Clostridiales bacterium]|jgi:D-alanyl-D-alanine carboxypeptidase|nr:D-alanyl-D-alanine carboxypeptidase family protein [Clostridiales bacterium]
MKKKILAIPIILALLASTLWVYGSGQLPASTPAKEEIIDPEAELAPLASEKTSIRYWDQIEEGQIEEGQIEEGQIKVTATPEPVEEATPKPDRYAVFLNAQKAEVRTLLDQDEWFLEAYPLLEYFGCVVFWNSDAQTIAVNTRDGILGTFKIGEMEVFVNGESVDPGFPALIVEDVIYISSGMLDALVDLDGIGVVEPNIWIDKRFETGDRNLQVKNILLQTKLPNYNPLNFTDYLAFQEQNPDLPADQVILQVNIGVHKEPYLDIQEVADPNGVFAVIDKNHKLDSSFKPTDLANYGGYLWKPEAGEAWLQMKSDAKADGLSLALNNSYRSIADQTASYNNKIRTRNKAAVERTNSRPGHSEHHTGYAADLTTVKKSNSKVDAWIAENSYKYGFIVSFQAGKEYINHYTPEPWHIRWYPLWAAEVMHAEGLTIQEFDNLYLNPNAHGFETDAERAIEIAERSYSKPKDKTTVASVVLVK